MKQRLGAAGLKVPKLFLTVAARDVLPGETVSIKVEVSRRARVYRRFLDELKTAHITELPAAEATPAAEEAAAEGGASKGDKEEEEQPRRLVGDWRVDPQEPDGDAVGGRQDDYDPGRGGATHFPIHTPRNSPFTPRSIRHTRAAFRF